MGMYGIQRVEGSLAILHLLPELCGLTVMTGNEDGDNLSVM